MICQTVCHTVIQECTPMTLILLMQVIMSKNIESYLNQDLENIYSWLRANRLTLNMTKTELMLIGSRQRQSSLTDSPTLKINGVKVKQVTNIKSLGVIIDDRLDWSSHIEKFIKNVASGIGQTTLKSIYQALIQPHFDYYTTVNCGSILQDKLQKLQNRAARVLTFSKYDTNAGHLFNILGWKNLKCQQQLQRATMVYRSLHGLAPDYLSSRFEKRETIYCLRDSDNKLKVPLPRTNYYQRSFTYSGATLWNSLPCQARQAESLGKLKYIIKQGFF